MMGAMQFDPRIATVGAKAAEPSPPLQPKPLVHGGLRGSRTRKMPHGEKCRNSLQITPSSSEDEDVGSAPPSDVPSDETTDSLA